MVHDITIYIKLWAI